MKYQIVCSYLKKYMDNSFKKLEERMNKEAIKIGVHHLSKIKLSDKQKVQLKQALFQYCKKNKINGKKRTTIIECCMNLFEKGMINELEKLMAFTPPYVQ